MLEDDLRALARQEPTTSLNGLERGVWRDVDSNTRASRAANLIAAWQVGVIAIVLIAPAEGLDELWADDAHRVTLALKLPGPMKGTGARLDADDDRGELRHKRKELGPT